MRLLPSALLIIGSLISFMQGLAIARREEGLMFKNIRVSSCTKAVIFPLKYLDLPYYNILGIIYLAITAVPSYIIIPVLLIMNILYGAKHINWFEIWGGVHSLLLIGFVSIAFLEGVISDVVLKRK